VVPGESTGAAQGPAAGVPGAGAAPSAEVDGALLRRTMGSFATGVAVITTESDGELQGMTLNSLTSVSLAPPLLLVCLMRGARTALSIDSSGAFVVNILRRRQQGIANHFAKRGDQRLTSPGIGRDALGTPYIPDSLARIHCRVDATHDGGDHVIVVGRIHECVVNDGPPLVFFRGTYHEVSGDGERADWWW
jgi:flavin reductase (DIM6/NTAB) family NADH-FMN oxidoreductase RutF